MFLLQVYNRQLDNFHERHTFDFNAIEVDIDAVFAALLGGERHAMDSVTQVNGGVWNRTAVKDHVQHHLTPACCRRIAREREWLTWHRSR